ncbi:MAG: 2-oxoisovalerate dehydrogenase [Leptolyngbya sp. DLM2.Bin27]|nr:MAG: 2-oxoisovalerate dehydrogenase [Leptolyngbya sp. DLM2.Bin27]
MTELIFLVEEDPESGFVAQALGEPIFTQAENLVELRAMVRDAVQCHFDENQRPKFIRLHIVKEEVIAS